MRLKEEMTKILSRSHSHDIFTKSQNVGYIHHWLTQQGFMILFCRRDKLTELRPQIYNPLKQIKKLKQKLERL